MKIPSAISTEDLANLLRSKGADYEHDDFIEQSTAGKEAFSAMLERVVEVGENIAPSMTEKERRHYFLMVRQLFDLFC